MGAILTPFIALYKQFISTSFDRFDQFLQSYGNFWLIHVVGTSYKEVIPAEGVPIIVDALRDAEISINAIKLMPVEASEQTATEYQKHYESLYAQAIIRNNIKKQLYDIL